MSAGNPDGVYSVIPFGWDVRPDKPTRIRWHTGDPDTDPWQWRLRVLNERDDVAYAKCFFRKGGYITKEWYPYFLAARRDGMDFGDAYADGLLSNFSKRIYTAIGEYGALALDRIKSVCGFTREDKSKFEAALVELQMKLFITICGSYRKVSKTGEQYGWETTVFSTAESFWGDEVFDAAARLSSDEAFDAILERIYALNPEADAAKARKFILG